MNRIDGGRRALSQASGAWLGRVLADCVSDDSSSARRRRRGRISEASEPAASRVDTATGTRADGDSTVPGPAGSGGADTYRWDGLPQTPIGQCSAVIVTRSIGSAPAGVSGDRHTIGSAPAGVRPVAREHAGG